MKITKKAQYGLRAMIYLAKNKGKICSIREVSNKEKIPFDFLEKVISILQKANFIKAKKGMHGGYYLLKKPKDIKMVEIIESLEGKISLVKCLKEFCPRSKSCSAKKYWEKLNKTIKMALSSITLEDLI